MVSFDNITDLIGYLVLTEDGAVLESGGELKNDEKRANLIVSLLQLTDSVDLKQFDKSDCQRISIVFETCSYTVCLSNKKIYIAKRLNRSQNRSNSLQTPDSLITFGPSSDADLTTHGIGGESNETA